MDSGWIKLWRKSLESGLMQNPELWMFWCWCLMKATHKPVKQMVGFQMVDLEPGQFIFGRKRASVELPLSERTIRTCLQKLEILEKLTIKTTNKFSVVSIINWDIYQDTQEQIDQQNDQHVTSKRPASDHKQECKNKRRKDINVPLNGSFDRFWDEYPARGTPPKREGRARAEKVWNTISRAGEMPAIDVVISCLREYKQRQTNPRYIKMPTTWLNDKPWRDQETPEQPSTGSPLLDAIYSGEIQVEVHKHAD